MIKLISIFMLITSVAMSQNGMGFFNMMIGNAGGDYNFTANLIAYYPLNGTAYDEISETAGIWRVNVVQTNDAVLGTAASVGESASEHWVTTVDTTLINGLSNITIACWVKLRSYTLTGGLLVLRSSTAYNVFIQQGNSAGLFRSQFNISDATPSKFSITDSGTNAIPLNVWTHVAVVSATTDKRRDSLYIDGEMVGFTETATTKPFQQNNKFAIGYDILSPLRASDGIFDEVRFYDIAQSTAWVKALYDRDNPN